VSVDGTTTLSGSLTGAFDNCDDFTKNYIQISATGAGSGASRRTIQIDAVTWAMSYVIASASPSSDDSTSATDTVSRIEPINADTDDDVSLVDEVVTVRVSGDDAGSAADAVSAYDATFAAAETASLADAVEQLRAVVADTGDAVDAHDLTVSVPNSDSAAASDAVSGVAVALDDADTSTAVDAGDIGNRVSDDDSGSTADDVDSLAVESADDDVFLIDEETDREFQQDDAGYAVDVISSEDGIPISDSDTGSGVDDEQLATEEATPEEGVAEGWFASEGAVAIIDIAHDDPATGTDAEQAADAELAAADDAAGAEPDSIIERAEAQGDFVLGFDSDPFIDVTSDDTATGADTVEPFAPQGADEGSAVEASTIAVTTSSADAVSFDDLFSSSPLANLLISNDPATGAEASSIAATRSSADTGSAVETEDVDSGTPRARTFYVEAEGRTYQIPPDSRVTLVPEAPKYRPPVRPRRVVRRRLEIEADDRRYVIAPDDRVAKIVPLPVYKPPLVVGPEPSRVYVIPAERRHFVVVRGVDG
jgi:hypothetical protein